VDVSLSESAGKQTAETPAKVSGTRGHRLLAAFAALVALAVLAYTTLSDERIRLVTLAILALFAVKTWLHRNDERMPESDR
jgi:heme A synthase